MNEEQCQECAVKNCICLECKQLLYVEDCLLNACPYEESTCSHFDGSEVFKEFLA